MPALVLLARLVPDVTRKPWHEDEAVAGLISARPLPDVIHTVVVDRGGAPLHFLLAHVAFAIDGSATTLRWLSVVFALATVIVCHDLARLLAGRLAGLTAASLAATSQLLTVYGTFGRMYSLFAFVSALSLDLFVRATERPSRGRLAAAGVAALLTLLVHPFGVFVFVAELAVAVWLWRARAAALAVVAAPLVSPYLRLPGRFAPDVGMSAPEATLRALGGSAGGFGIGLALFAALAVVGAWQLPRAFAALGLLVIALPALALTLLTRADLSPRHLIFMLPIWTTFVATGLAKLPFAVPVAAAALAVAVLAPTVVADPRTSPAGQAGAVAAPAAWIRDHVEPGDLLYPYSPVFLAALPRTELARSLPREPVALSRALRRTGDVHAVFVAIPLSSPILRGVPGAHVFRSWLIVQHRGSFAGVPRLLARLAPELEGTSAYAGLLQLRGAACRC